MKEFIKRHLRRFDIDVGSASVRRSVMDYMNSREIDVVLDVGANVGQFGTGLRDKGYRGRIISFEPVQSVFQTLAATAQADSDWDVHNFALGVAPAHATINVAELSVFSSLLPATGAAAAFDDTAVATHPETIEVRTLNECVSDLSGNILLKIDTQGYEKQVLEGGRQVLSRLKGVLMELPIIHLYEGTWRFYEAVAYMAESNFVPAQIHPVNFHSKDDVSLVEVDCLFRPRDSTID
jgi:FkbM family methyltransferase